MGVSDLQRLYDYGYWANRRLFLVMSGLTPAEFTRPVVGSSRSIRDILVHVISAEWGWLSRCGGPARGPALKPADYPTVEAVVETWAIVEGHTRAFVSKLEDHELTGDVEFENPSGDKRSMPLGELLQHAANHGVHHRGQVALLLSLLGHQPGNVDMLSYDAERRGVTAW
jgi:uncharacterized damage-inducible protein DinB